MPRRTGRVTVARDNTVAYSREWLEVVTVIVNDHACAKPILYHNTVASVKTNNGLDE